MNPKEIMDRVHIIVGPNGECMCGSQEDGQIRSCKEILEETIVSLMFSKEPEANQENSHPMNNFEGVGTSAQNGNQPESPKFPCKICGKEQKYDPEYECLEFCNHYNQCLHCGKNVLVCEENLSHPLLCDECIKNGVDIRVVVKLDESKKAQ
ncbi:MAG: hypothetical protein M0R32_09825 [Candidatus Cloacimonetes bacterium]|jgi:hypothetical protein|nr:hypothetical protein [Candidatus Cloacimonadota bacterium]